MPILLMLQFAQTWVMIIELEGGLEQVDSKSVIKKLSKLTPEEFETLIQTSFMQIEGCGLKNEIERDTLRISEDPELAVALESLLAPIVESNPLKFGTCSSMSNQPVPLVRRMDKGEGVEMVLKVDDVASSNTPPDKADVDECCICLESLEESTMETFKCKGCKRLLYARY